MSAFALPLYLLLCLLLGGASLAGLWANVGLQLLAIPFLLAAALARPRASMTPAGRRLVWLFALLAALFAVQLVPLPPAVWTALPGRDHVREGFELLGRPLPWMPLSLAPHATLAAALWLLPAAAVLFAMLRLRVRFTWMAWTIVVATGLSVLVGAAQIAGGRQSPWYIYEFTSFGVMTGLFSNANHMATLLVVTIPFLGALFMTTRGRDKQADRSAALVVILFGLLGLLLVGLVINGSLAGLGLMLPAGAATFLMMRRKSGVPGWAVGLVALLTLGAVGAIFGNVASGNLLGDEAQTSIVSRQDMFAVSAEAAADHFPVGSGIGTFPSVYRLYENADAVTPIYVNHVHSDWIEIVLEAGLPAILLLLLFLAWWAERAIAIWRLPAPDYLARAATIASAAIIAHSLVDYPLRTAAISAVFAACCAMMAGRRSAPERPRKAWLSRRPARHLAAD